MQVAETKVAVGVTLREAAHLSAIVLVKTGETRFLYGGVTWPDLVTWPYMTQDRKFHKCCQKMGDKVDENPAAMRAAVFLLSAKNRKGCSNPPGRAKVKPFLFKRLLFLVSPLETTNY